MLPKMHGSSIQEMTGFYEVTDGIQIYAQTLFKDQGDGKTALYIHGGGSGGNHTIVTRGARWMLHQGLFSRMILPDRRGAGLSSPLTRMMTYQDNARDMQGLLNCMDVKDKVTAIGISYGGPIALTLAAIDTRIDKVILIASSPSLKPVTGLWGFMYRHNMLEPLIRFSYKRYVGKLEPVYPNFDDVYEAKSTTQLARTFFEQIKHIPKERLESLILENASTCDLNNQGLAEDLQITVPVYRVIGNRDETWEVELGDIYREQIPFIKTAFIEGASHKDVFFRAQEFYSALYQLLVNRGSTVGAMPASQMR
jgi:pimeloyl-ACP methyl ester carboxylesterase